MRWRRFGSGLLEPKSSFISNSRLCWLVVEAQRFEVAGGSTQRAKGYDPTVRRLHPRSRCRPTSSASFSPRNASSSTSRAAAWSICRSFASHLVVMPASGRHPEEAASLTQFGDLQHCNVTRNGPVPLTLMPQGLPDRSAGVCEHADCPPNVFQNWSTSMQATFEEDGVVVCSSGCHTAQTLHWAWCCGVHYTSRILMKKSAV